MTAATFDTYKSVRQMMSEGLPEKQATAIVQVIQASQLADSESVVTKADLYTVKAELKADVHEAKAELTKLMFTGFIAIVGLLVAILFRMHG